MVASQPYVNSTSSIGVSNSREFKQAFVDSAVGSIVLLNDITIEPADWEYFDSDLPYVLTRNLTITSESPGPHKVS